MCHDRRGMFGDRDRSPVRSGAEDRYHGLPQGLRDGAQPLDGTHRTGHRRPDRPPEDGVQEGDVRADRESKDEDPGQFICATCCVLVSSIFSLLMQINLKSVYFYWVLRYFPV